MQSAATETALALRRRAAIREDERLGGRGGTGALLHRWRDRNEAAAVGTAWQFLES